MKTLKIEYNEGDKVQVLINGEEQNLGNDNTPWRAEKDGTYFFVDEGLMAYEDMESYDSVDGARYLLGNYFRTEKEAQEYADYLRAMAEVSLHIRSNYPFQPDWSDDKERKFSIKLSREGWQAEDWRTMRTYTFLPAMSCEEHAKQVIRNKTKELEIIKNYLLTHNI